MHRTHLLVHSNGLDYIYVCTCWFTILSYLLHQGTKFFLEVGYKVCLCEKFQQQSCSITIPPSNGPQILARNIT